MLHTLAGIIHWKLCGIEHGFIRHAREAKERRSIVTTKHGQEDDILMNTHFIIQITESVYSWSLLPASEIAQRIHVRFRFSLFAVFIFILTLPSGLVNKSGLQPWQSFGKLPELAVQGACYTTTSSCSNVSVNTKLECALIAFTRLDGFSRTLKQLDVT